MVYTHKGQITSWQPADLNVIDKTFKHKIDYDLISLMIESRQRFGLGEVLDSIPRMIGLYVK